ncbi:MAG TPA: hypothetical protein VKH19_14370 [Gemmatimonadaceae bacterium]|nr:hypothetical protein [Gemmatimonadaceae bacterium]
MRIAIRSLAATALFATTAFVSAGPPWISIEYPANPYDAASRGAVLLVHTFHHGTSVGYPVSGTAEGMVNGARRTVSLEFKPTSRPGVYALHKQWANDGVWTLVISASQGAGEGNMVTAVVELATNGKVASVDVPTRQRGEWLIPASVSMTDVDAGLRARAARLASR